MTVNSKLVEWAYIAMMPVSSASVESGPSLFVFKGRITFHNIVHDNRAYTGVSSFKLSVGSVTTTTTYIGGVDTVSFLSCAEKFVSYTKQVNVNDKKLLIIYDGYRAPLSVSVLKLIETNNIIAYSLSSYTS